MNRTQILSLPKVIITFPHLVEKCPLGKYVLKEDDRDYSATFLLSKDNEDHKRAMKEMLAFEKDMLKVYNKASFTYPCFKDGDKEYEAKSEEKKEAYAYLKNKWIIPAKNDYKPKLEKRLNVPYVHEEGEKELFYGGCIINALITLSCKIIRGIPPVTVSRFLDYVCFVRDGERLGATRVNPADYFKDDENEDIINNIDNNENEELF